MILKSVPWCQCFSPFQTEELCATTTPEPLLQLNVAKYRPRLAYVVSSGPLSHPSPTIDMLCNLHLESVSRPSSVQRHSSSCKHRPRRLRRSTAAAAVGANCVIPRRRHLYANGRGRKIENLRTPVPSLTGLHRTVRVNCRRAPAVFSTILLSRISSEKQCSLSRVRTLLCYAMLSLTFYCL